MNTVFFTRPLKSGWLTFFWWDKLWDFEWLLLSWNRSPIIFPTFYSLFPISISKMSSLKLSCSISVIVLSRYSRKEGERRMLETSNARRVQMKKGIFSLIFHLFSLEGMRYDPEWIKMNDGLISEYQVKPETCSFHVILIYDSFNPLITLSSSLFFLSFAYSSTYCCFKKLPILEMWQFFSLIKS